MTTVRPAIPDDVPALVELMEELERFYGHSPAGSRDERVDTVRDVLFGEIQSARVLLAWLDDQLVGFAAYSFLWPAHGVTRSMYLKELFVRPEHHRAGIGNDLMRDLCRAALDARCSRVEWTTDHSNTGAVAFYANLGARVRAEKTFHRLGADAIAQLAEIG